MVFWLVRPYAIRALDATKEVLNMVFCAGYFALRRVPERGLIMNQDHCGLFQVTHLYYVPIALAQ
jgi:hypothetical protein